jgi:hypothetical protein
MDTTIADFAEFLEPQKASLGSPGRTLLGRSGWQARDVWLTGRAAIDMLSALPTEPKRRDQQRRIMAFSFPPGP